MNVIKEWAKSAGGHAISLAYGGGFVFEKNHKPLLFIGGVHGDEPEGVELATRFLQYLEHSSEKTSPWILIPCLNPDGYMKVERTNGNGVDLNRNYPAKNWSPDCDAPRYFPGTKAASEPEIQALTALIEAERPRLILHFHSWKPCIVCSGEKGRLDAQRLARASNYEIVSDIGYPTPGSLSSFANKDHDIPVICIEEEAGVALAEVWPRFQPALIEILNDTSMRDK
tara:strand:+ start:206 stop:886 length:681 start_codon:yes stop_codon:yes gene_type:complete